MPMPSVVQTVAMVAGTVVAASGLNLGVMSLGQPDDATSSEDAAGADSDPTAPVEQLVDSPGEIVAAAAPLDASTEPPTPESGVGQPAALPAPAPAAPAPADPGPAQADSAAAAAPAAAQPAADPASNEPPASIDQPAPTTAAPTTLAAPPTSPATDPPTTTAPPPPDPTTAPPIQTEYLTYVFEGVAEIIIALHEGSRLEFWSATREPGIVYRVDDDGPTKVKVKFMRLSDEEESEFVVSLDEDGELDVKMEH